MLVFNKNNHTKYILLHNLKKDDKSHNIYPIVPLSKRSVPFHIWIEHYRSQLLDMVEYISEKLLYIAKNTPIYINKIKLFDDISSYVYKQSSNKYNHLRNDV